MAEKKKFLLRIEAGLYAALEKWAADELRSINSQIEFVLSNSVKNAGRYISTKSEDSKNSNNNKT